MIIDFNIVEKRQADYLRNLLDMFFNRNDYEYAMISRKSDGIFEIKRLYPFNVNGTVLIEDV